MAWILIVWLTSGAGSAKVVGKYETRFQCQRAGEERARAKPSGEIRYTCTRERAR